MSINKNQKEFFEKYFKQNNHGVFVPSEIYDSYVNGAQYRALSKYDGNGDVLDYGCGNGELIQRFLHVNPSFKHSFIGVDISDSIIDIAKTKYPNHFFYNINTVDIENIKKSNFGFMMHVLHHSTNHQEIFNNIHYLLNQNSVFIIEDLFGLNPFIKVGRFVFRYLPSFIKRRFSGDLLVDNQIPEKLPVDFKLTLALLSKKFDVIHIEYSQLFCFIFIWFINISNQYDNKYLMSLFKIILIIEKFLIEKTFMKNYCEVRTIYVRRK